MDDSAKCESEKEDPDEATQAWEQWLETMATIGGEGGENVPLTLEAYLMAKQARHSAKQAFEDAMDECLNGLTQAMTVELIQDTVGVVYQEQSEPLDELQTDILTTIQSNHERRKVLLQTIEHTNTIWERHYKKLRRSILNEGYSEDDRDHETQDDEKGDEDKKVRESCGECVASSCLGCRE
jgi:hypothetical protein